MHRRTFLRAAAAGLILPLAPRLTGARASTAQADSWVVLDLGEIDNRGRVRGMNNSGQVVGAMGQGEVSHAFLWDGSAMVDLGTLGGASSGANAINDAGQIVGWAQLPDGATHPFLWQGGTMTDLGALGLTSSLADPAIALAINNAGVVVGALPQQAGSFLWHDGVLTQLDSSGSAAAINDDGVVAGFVIVDGVDQACIWRAGQRQLVFGDPSSAPLGSVAESINAAGDVLGTVALKPHRVAADLTAFLWDGAAATFLPDLFTEGNLAINDNGQIIGPAQYSPDAGATYVALSDLSQLAVLSPGGAINDRGQIALAGLAADDRLHAYLLSPG